MGYNLLKIRKLKAIRLHGHKTDVQIQIKIWLKKAIVVENISIKKANHDADYNQVDKRWVDKYKEMWNIPKGIVECLKKFTGETSPSQLLKNKKITKKEYDSLKDKRRFFINEFNKREIKKLLDFFRNNKLLIVSDIIKGNDKFAANWMLVTKDDKINRKIVWILTDINNAMNVFGQGDVKVSPQGSLYIGRITMQRKGGDAGRKTANMLQFKVKPCDLFKY